MATYARSVAYKVNSRYQNDVVTVSIFLLFNIFTAGSKHAVNGFFHSLRIEMKGQVNVTVVCPGYVWTAFQDSKLSAGKDSSEGSRDKKKFMTAEQCVREIHDAIKYNEAEYIMTLKGKAGVVAQALLPRAIIDKMATSTKNAAHQKH
jgi:short-subunit dehydrogenase